MKLLNDLELETAARKLCELQGLDPDEGVGHEAEPDARGYVPAIYYSSPRWTLVVKELRHLNRAMCAIHFATTPSTP